MINFTIVSLLMAFSSVNAVNTGPYLFAYGEASVEEEEPPSYLVASSSDVVGNLIPEKDDGGAGSGRIGLSEDIESAIKAGEVSVEEFVRNYFKDIPVMAEIARCESTFRHFNSNGDVLRGMVNKSDVGVMQINEYYHLETAKRFEMDIYTIEGNLAYARNLYNRKGVQPWVHSSKCWKR